MAGTEGAMVAGGYWHLCTDSLGDDGGFVVFAAAGAVFDGRSAQHTRLLRSTALWLVNPNPHATNHRDLSLMEIVSPLRVFSVRSGD